MKTIFALVVLALAFIGRAEDTNKVIELRLPTNLQYDAKMNAPAGSTNIFRIDLKARWVLKNSDGTDFWNEAVIKNYPYRKSEWNLVKGQDVSYSQFPKKPIIGNVVQIKNDIAFGVRGQAMARTAVYRWID